MNPGPDVYKTTALPLSYLGKLNAIERISFYQTGEPWASISEATFTLKRFSAVGWINSAL